MYSWRVTKYDPANRDANGRYLDDEEWTCFSEIGAKLGLEEYLEIEDKYLNAIMIFMAEMRLNGTYVTGLEYWPDEDECPTIQAFLSKIRNGSYITVQEVQELAKLILRNVVWCKLEFKHQFFVHVGYDYYMYIGASKNCRKAVEVVRESGLFVEEIDSPYLTS